MTSFRHHLDILCSYHDDYVARGVESLGTSNRHGGSAFWKVQGRKGTFLLRRQDVNTQPLERVEYIHAVQWHSKMEGFRYFPMPVETLEGMSYVVDGDFFWQLEPWIEGKADFRKNPGTDRLVNAMTALAEFHHATQTFPVVQDSGPSPRLLEHEKMLLRWTDSRLQQLEENIQHSTSCEVEGRGDVTFISDLFDADASMVSSGLQIGNSVTIALQTNVQAQMRLQNTAMRILKRVRALRRSVLLQVVRAGNESLRIQPCLYDISPEHLFFQQERFTGFTDFSSLGNDCAAVDVARMLNALTNSRPKYWLLGLAAYQSVRPLNASELLAVQVFRRSAVLVTAIRWLEFIFTQNHPVKCSSHLVQRLERLASIVERI